MLLSLEFPPILILPSVWMVGLTLCSQQTAEVSFWCLDFKSLNFRGDEKTRGVNKHFGKIVSPGVGLSSSQD